MKVDSEETIKAFSLLKLKIQESQGFLLPSNLHKNDDGLRIASKNNIQEEAIKISPMVGDGPDLNQKFCMYQYEAGTRTR